MRHPWLFSGALDTVPEEIAHGSLVHIADSGGKVVATGTYSARSMIAVRVLDFSEVAIDRAWLRKTFDAAAEKRARLGLSPDGSISGYRVVFGECDNLPGLIVDRYNDILVIQISTAGIENLKSDIVAVLVEMFAPKTILERSDLPVRKEEGLADQCGVLFGADVDTVEIREGSFRFLVDVLNGQKTGFYLDQRELRSAIHRYAKGCSVLNLFSNSGSFAVAALKGGATHVLNIDSSQPALDLIDSQLQLNELPKENCSFECRDVFEWISSQTTPAYDMVIVDPPALIKSHRDADSGGKAYHFLNRAAVRLTNDQGIFVTSSCSSFLPETAFLEILRRASVQANVHLEVLERVGQPRDHPVSLYFPESAYLKSFICLVKR